MKEISTLTIVAMCLASFTFIVTSGCHECQETNRMRELTRQEAIAAGLEEQRVGHYSIWAKP